MSVVKELTYVTWWLNHVMSFLGVSITAWGDCGKEIKLDVTFDGFLMLDSSSGKKDNPLVKHQPTIMYNNYLI
jgi:hypothetical protein